MLPIDLGEPGIRIDHIGNLQQGGQCGKCHPGRAIATGETLMRALPVVMLPKALCHLVYLLQRRRAMTGEAFLFISPMIPFDKSILLPMVRITYYNCDTQAVRDSDQGSREVAALGSAHESVGHGPG
jgi:hypothetical protein